MRELTPDEQKKLKELTALSTVDDDTAFQKSLIINGKTIRLGVYGIMMRGKEILMTQTQSGTKNILNFPGGEIEMGENLHQALKRECFEELGLEVKVDKLLHSSQSLYIHDDFPEYRMFNFYFLINPINEIGNGELITKWHCIDNLPIDSMLPIDVEFIPILQKLFSEIS